MMAPKPSLISLILIAFAVASSEAASSTWCMARSDASVAALQAALDYACGTGGADCAPLQASNGLCFLPNTIQAHASYAFNSYYHRRSMAPGSCDFSATATISQSDPSYGSCVYPSSLSTAGGSSASGSTNGPVTLTPATMASPGFNGGYNPGSGTTPTIPDNVDESRASRNHAAPTLVVSCVLALFLS